jgi:hypothetical protein
LYEYDAVSLQRDSELWDVYGGERVEKHPQLLATQIRWNPLPVLALCHFARQKQTVSPDAAGLAHSAMFMRLRRQLQLTENPQPDVGLKRRAHHIHDFLKNLSSDDSQCQQCSRSTSE